MSFEIVKVIIDGDMPFSCMECKRCNYELGYCEEMDRVLEYPSHKSTRPDWCPLTTEAGYLEELAEQYERDKNEVEARPEYSERNEVDFRTGRFK